MSALFPFIAEHDAYAMPAFAEATSPEMLAIAERYVAGFTDTSEKCGDIWDAAARECADYSATTPADLATKLLIQLHYQQPGWIEGKPALLNMFDTDAGRDMMFSAISDILAMAQAQKEEAE